jgi:hypothetical protein
VKWFDPIACDNTVPDPYVADDGDIGMQDWMLRSGQAIGNWPKDAWIKAAEPENDGDPDDVLQSYLGVPIYSARLRVALGEIGMGDIQYLPIRVLRPNGEEIEGFSIANITTVRDALDRKRSDISRFADNFPAPSKRGLISAVRKTVLLGSRLGGCDIFRLDGYRVAYYVSERFKEVFEKGGFTGYSFHGVLAPPLAAA